MDSFQFVVQMNLLNLLVAIALTLYKQLVKACQILKLLFMTHGRLSKKEQGVQNLKIQKNVKKEGEIIPFLFFYAPEENEGLAERKESPLI